MINIKNIVISSLIVGAPAALADDLLDVLGGSASEEILVTQGELAQEIRKVIKSPTAEQNIFIQFVNDKKYDKALFQWWNAFERTTFPTTDNGKALFSYLLSKNGLKVVALEHANSIKDFKGLNPKLQNFLKQEFPLASESWNYATISWNKDRQVFWGDTLYIKNISYRANLIKSSNEIIELLKISHLQDDQVFWLKWQLGMRLIAEGQSDKAAKVLSHILKKEKGPVSEELINMTAARILYERGYLTPAISYYQKINKNSDYWFTAQEEMAWSYIRKGQPQDTIAVTQGLVNPMFDNVVGAETYMLRSLAQLKVCDYTSSLATIKKFGQVFKSKYSNFKKISLSEPVPQLDKFINNLKKDKVTWKTVGADAAVLPSFIYRDEVLAKLVRVQNSLEQEVAQVEELYKQSLAGASATVGYQASVDNLKKSVENKARIAKSASYARVKEIANYEMKEITQVLSKMHIIEAEVIQQVSFASKALASKVKETSVKAGTTGSKSKYALSFPLENEVWVDELDNYKVDIKKACQAKKD